MPKQRTPNILIVDDQNGQSGIKSYLENQGVANIEVLHPQDIEIKDLLNADLVLVDYNLDNWPERDNIAPIALKPLDGLALSAVLRSQLRDREDTSPTAFAIFTGVMDRLAAPLPPDYREHVLASINNLEWVFQKAVAGSEAPVANQILSLASAVQKLPKVWPIATDDDPMRKLAELLGVELEKPEGEQLLEDIETCLPPIHELSQWSHGLIVLRWMLHRILPFPCFLWDTYRLAARFRIDHKALCDVLNTGTKLHSQLTECEYTGILSDFLGPRWWRSKIELFLWQATKGNSSDNKAVQTAIREAAGVELAPSDPPDFPVVCVNTSYQPVEDFSPMADAVRISPDDWPAYADQAWTTIELAKSEPKLRALVIREDKELLD